MRALAPCRGLHEPNESVSPGRQSGQPVGSFSCVAPRLPSNSRGRAHTRAARGDAASLRLLRGAGHSGARRPDSARAVHHVQEGQQRQAAEVADQARRPGTATEPAAEVCEPPTHRRCHCLAAQVCDWGPCARGDGEHARRLARADRGIRRGSPAIRGDAGDFRAPGDRQQQAARHSPSTRLDAPAQTLGLAAGAALAKRLARVHTRSGDQEAVSTAIAAALAAAIAAEVTIALAAALAIALAAALTVAFPAALATSHAIILAAAAAAALALAVPAMGCVAATAATPVTASTAAAAAAARGATRATRSVAAVGISAATLP